MVKAVVNEDKERAWSESEQISSASSKLICWNTPLLVEDDEAGEYVNLSEFDDFAN